jgi:hypothetical protein
MFYYDNEITESRKRTAAYIKNTIESRKRAAAYIKNTTESRKRTVEYIKNTTESRKRTVEYSNILQESQRETIRILLEKFVASKVENATLTEKLECILRSIAVADADKFSAEEQKI